MCFCFVFFFHPVLPSVSRPQQLFRCFSPELHAFGNSRSWKCPSLSDLTANASTSASPGTAAESKDDEETPITYESTLWPQLASSRRRSNLFSHRVALCPSIGPSEPEIPLAAEWHQSPRIYCITSFFQASGSKWMFFVFGIVCALGCLVFYWHELLETQGWLNMTFFYTGGCCWYLSCSASPVFVTFSMSLFMDVFTLSPSKRTQTYNFYRTEVHVVAHYSMWIVNTKRSGYNLPFAIVF